MPKPRAIEAYATDIVAPLITVKGHDQVVRVTRRSSLSHRRAVYQQACYFKREMRYDFAQYGYDGREDDPDHVAFLWVHPEALGFASEFRVPCVGATCFRLREERWAMQWVWVHPFYRRRGMLSDAWGAFVAEFGDFDVEEPLSDAMSSFLARRREQHTPTGG